MVWFANFVSFRMLQSSFGSDVKSVHGLIKITSVLGLALLLQLVLIQSEHTPGFVAPHLNRKVKQYAIYNGVNLTKTVSYGYILSP